MKKSIFWVLGFVFLLSSSFAEKLPAHARRSSVLAAVGGTCTRYSCATYKGFEQCLLAEHGYKALEVHTHKEDNAVFGAYRNHPNCYRSFCIANCMVPPGIDENLHPQKDEDLFTVNERSDTYRKLSKLKDKQHATYMREMNQFIHSKRANCSQNDGLGPIMRRFCSFCGTSSLASEGYKMIEACKFKKEDFPEGREKRLGRLIKRSPAPETGGGTFSMLTQAGAQALKGAAAGLQEQGQAALGHGKVYLANQGKEVHKMAQKQIKGHIKAGSRQVENARNHAFKEAQGLGKRASSLASGLTDRADEEKKKLRAEYANFQKKAKAREREILRMPERQQERLLDNLEKKKEEAKEKYEEKLREIEERTSDEESEVDEEEGHEGEEQGGDEEDLGGWF